MEAGRKLEVGGRGAGQVVFAGKERRTILDFMVRRV